jgi:hypothetical protein
MDARLACIAALVCGVLGASLIVAFRLDGEVVVPSDTERDLVVASRHRSVWQASWRVDAAGVGLEPATRRPVRARVFVPAADRPVDTFYDPLEHGCPGAHPSLHAASSPALVTGLARLEVLSPPSAEPDPAAAAVGEWLAAVGFVDATNGCVGAGASVRLRFRLHFDARGRLHALTHAGPRLGARAGERCLDELAQEWTSSPTLPLLGTNGAIGAVVELDYEWRDTRPGRAAD